MKDFIYAYVRKVPFKYDVNKKICNERLSYLESIKQNGIMKYYGWRLLELAFEEKLGIDINELNPRRLDTGKWVVDDYYISLSYRDNYIICGISNEPIGVGIEKQDKEYDEKELESMCDEEIERFKDNPSAFCYHHVDKEALYKCFGNEGLGKNKLNILLYEKLIVHYHKNDYIHTVCSPLIVEGVDLYIYIDDNVVKVTSNVFKIPEEIGFIK